MDKKKTSDFDQDAYKAYLATLDLDELAKEQDKQEILLRNYRNEYETSREYLNEHLDQPQYEHLIEMRLQEAPGPLDLFTQELKITMIIQAFNALFKGEEDGLLEDQGLAN